MFEIKSKIRNYTVEFQDKIKIDFQKDDFLFVDENVHRLYKKQFPKTKNIFVIRASEQAKEFKEINLIITQLLLMNFKKNNRIVVVGGGAVQDVAGFVSSILFRGVKWVFYPTTLVAQADSCIGSKTSINFCGRKNIIGTFYPPSKITICTKFLETLPEQEIKSGIGEILHYLILFGKGKEIHDLEGSLALFECDYGSDCLLPWIKMSLRLKKRYVLLDEFDKGIRNLFNYGHTFGHACESISNFNLPHGLAVTKGMDMANWLAWKFGLITKKRYDYLTGLIEFNIPEFTIKSAKQFIQIMSADKKNTENSINFILPFANTEFIKVPIKNDSLLLNQIQEYISCGEKS